ncbi:hypothetical protein GJAV_G00081000 [Gymnothorax javanicus]|nr:hypothetical protein GJAV_G00081000 [Gymnothorax javanicus]
MAGKDWLTSFLERNKTLSIRRPQATSMSRSTSFNKTNVTAFFKNLKTVLTHYNFEAKDIWNMDETGTTMVQVPDKIIATKGQRQMVRGRKRQKEVNSNTDRHPGWIGEETGVHLWPPCMFSDMSEYLINSGERDLQTRLLTDYKDGKLASENFREWLNFGEEVLQFER